MKIKELIKKVNETECNLHDVLKIKTYLPVLDKKKLILDVISECTYEEEIITVDRFNMHIYFNMKMLSCYTNLDIATNFIDMIKQYDQLCETGIMKKIIDLIKEDYVIVQTLLKDELESMLIQNSIDVQVVRLTNKIHGVIDVVSEKLSDVDFNTMLPEGTDINGLVKMLDLLK